jgi:hypothetical protein
MEFDGAAVRWTHGLRRRCALEQVENLLYFDTAAECEAIAIDEQRTGKDSDARNAARESKCIAADDPRLKGK